VYTTGQFSEVSQGYGGSSSSPCQWIPELNVFTNGFGGIERAQWSGLTAGSWYFVSFILCN
jgi:hypothetical protein